MYYILANVGLVGLATHKHTYVYIYIYVTKMVNQWIVNTQNVTNPLVLTFHVLVTLVATDFPRPTPCHVLSAT